MPNIDPDLALKLARQVADIYGDAQTEMLRRVSRRLARGVDKPGWAEAKRAEIRRLRHEALVDIRRLERLGPEAVRVAIEEGFGAGLEAAKNEGHISAAESFIGTNRAAIRAIGDLVNAVAAGGVEFMCLESARFVQANGQIWIDAEAGTTGNLQVYRLPKGV